MDKKVIFCFRASLITKFNDSQTKVKHFHTRFLVGSPLCTRYKKLWSVKLESLADLRVSSSLPFVLDLRHGSFADCDTKVITLHLSSLLLSLLEKVIKIFFGKSENFFLKSSIFDIGISL